MNKAPPVSAGDLDPAPPSINDALATLLEDSSFSEIMAVTAQLLTHSREHPDDHFIATSGAIAGFVATLAPHSSEPEDIDACFKILCALTHLAANAANQHTIADAPGALKRLVDFLNHSSSAIRLEAAKALSYLTVDADSCALVLNLPDADILARLSAILLPPNIQTIHVLTDLAHISEKVCLAIIKTPKLLSSLVLMSNYKPVSAQIKSAFTALTVHTEVRAQIIEQLRAFSTGTDILEPGRADMDRGIHENAVKLLRQLSLDAPASAAATGVAARLRNAFNFRWLGRDSGAPSAGAGRDEGPR